MKVDLLHSWLRFNVRTLLLLTSLFAGALAWQLNQANLQRKSVRAVREMGGHVDYLQTAATVPRWLVNSLGVDFFYTVEAVDLTAARETTDSGQRDRNSLFQALRPLSGVKSLVVRGSHANDETMEIIGTLTKLESLNITSCSYRYGRIQGVPAITDIGISKMSHLNRLSEFALSSGNLTDKSLVVLGKLTELQKLVLRPAGYLMRGDAFTDVGVKHLAKLDHLRELRLRSSLLTDTTLLHLQSLPDLEILDLQGGEFSDSGLASVGKLKTLKELHLLCKTSRVTDSSIPYIVGLPALSSLVIRCNVTDAGLVLLGSVDQVYKSVSIGTSNASASAVQQLRSSLAAGEIYVGPISIENTVRHLLLLKTSGELESTVPLLFPLDDDAAGAMETLREHFQASTNENLDSLFAAVAEGKITLASMAARLESLLDSTSHHAVDSTSDK